MLKSSFIQFYKLHIINTWNNYKVYWLNYFHFCIRFPTRDVGCSIPFGWLQGRLKLTLFSGTSGCNAMHIINQTVQNMHSIRCVTFTIYRYNQLTTLLASWTRYVVTMHRYKNFTCCYKHYFILINIQLCSKRMHYFIMLFYR